MGAPLSLHGLCILYQILQDLSILSFGEVMAFLTFFKHIASRFLSKQISTFSAAASFYILLSTLPVTVIFVSILTLLPLVKQELFQILPTIIPSEFLDLLHRLDPYLQLQPSHAIVSVSFLTTLWSASKGLHAVAEGLSCMMETDSRMIYLRRRLRSAILFLILVISTVLCIGLSSLLKAPWRYVFLLLSFTMLLSVLLYDRAEKQLPLYRCIPGAFFSSLGWILISRFFPLYMRYVSKYPRSYGGIGLVLLCCIWLQLCLCVLLIGARLSYLLHTGFADVHE